MRKWVFFITVLLVCLLLAACQRASPVPPPAATPTPQPAPVPSLTATMPEVSAAEPSRRVLAFYYPWYRNVDVDGEWVHWEEGAFRPPLDISSDFYPLLGAYSSMDTEVVAQHFAWLRHAGVGIIATSWWGQGSREDRVVPLLLEMGERYGIQVAFHLEPYGGRSASMLVADIKYLYERYGEHPAFFLTTAASRWSPNDRPKGLFFLWASRYPDLDKQPVEADYWRESMDAIHTLPQGGLVIADETLAEWVDGGHFDGLYNYAVLQPDEVNAYQWARTLPPGAWYVPGVNPGFSAVRIGYDQSTYVPRRDGEAYQQRWQAALDVGVQPAMLAITSFNEWHEGTQIEPAVAGGDNGRGHVYDDYGSLPPDGYLALTRRWVDLFEEKTWPESPRVRLRLVTSSDWTTLGLLDGAVWIQPNLVSFSDGVDFAGSEGERFLLAQPFNNAQQGNRVEVILDVLLIDMEPDSELVLEIERGHLGATWLEVATFTGDEPEVVASFVWDRIAPGERNAQQFRLPITALLK